jgi:hypothetical protein
LFRRPNSPVEIERYGIDHAVLGLGGAAVLLVGALLAATDYAPRAGALLAAVVAATATVRLVVGEHRSSSVGEVWLHGSWGLLGAAVAAWVVTACALLLGRPR